MYPVGVNLRYYNYNTSLNSQAEKVSAVSNSSAQPTVGYVINPLFNDRIPFNPSFASSKLRTRMNSQEEKNKYNTILTMLDKSSKKKMKELLKTGILLNANSNDNSTVLDNLYNIAIKERAHGLSREGILKDTIDTLSDPHVITQQFGDIPENQKATILDLYMKEQQVDKNNILQRKNAENKLITR